MLAEQEIPKEPVILHFPAPLPIRVIGDPSQLTLAGQLREDTLSVGVGWAGKVRVITTHITVLRPLACVAILLPFVVSFSPRTSWAWDGGPQCVPFARALSNIRLFGDAWRWWSAAAGLYNRGANPQAGSILSFRPDARIPLGHIAVVTRVINGREIEVDQANWAHPGAISRQDQVLDVSTDNNWTAVRVGLRGRDNFGAVYATNGFIYGWPIPAATMSPDAGQMERYPRTSRLMSGRGVAFALTFDQIVSHGGSQLTLVTPTGNTRRIPVRLVAQPNTLYASIGGLAPGDYRLEWEAQVADGTRLHGSLPFNVGQHVSDRRRLPAS